MRTDSYRSRGRRCSGGPDAPYTLDVADFEQALTRAEQSGEERAALEKAIDRYGGDLLPSCYDDWILPERERLHQAYIRAMERLIQVLEAEREYDQAIRMPSACCGTIHCTRRPTGG